MRRAKTILKITQKARFLEVINELFIYKCRIGFSNHQKPKKHQNISKAVVFLCRLLPNIHKDWDHIWDFPTIWEMKFRQTCWKVQLLYFNWPIKGPGLYQVSIPNKCPVFGEKFLISALVQICIHVQLKLYTNLNKRERTIFVTNFRRDFVTLFVHFFIQHPGPVKHPVQISTHPKGFNSE